MKKIKYTLLIFMTFWLFLFQINPIQFLAYDLLTFLIVRDDTPQIGINEIPENAVILDTRARIEYNISHLPQAQWVGPSPQQLDTLNLLKDQPIIVYCSVGYRSGLVGEKLLEKGYQQVYNLSGGLFKWHNEGRPLVRGQHQTKDIHPYSSFWGIWIEGGNRTYSLPPIPRPYKPTER